MDWAAFSQQVGAERDCGEVVILCAPGNGLGGWEWLSSGQPREGTFPVSREEAGHILKTLLTHDLAYHAPLLPVARAAELSRTYLNDVHPGARLFTNTDPSKLTAGRLPSGWTPLTDATFDLGIYSLHPGQQTVFWVLDED